MAEDDCGDEPPPLPAEPPPAGNVSANGGHTPESIARLPAKLRQRLLQRGILKATDLDQAAVPAVPASVPAAVVKAKAAKARADLPPMPSFTPMDLAAAQSAAAAAAARIDADWATVMAPPAAATPQQRPQQVVYASAPVLRTEKRTAPSASEPEAKRQMQAAGSSVAGGLPPTEPLPPPPEPLPSPTAAPPGPPLPPGWVRVPHEGEFYFWNMNTNEVSWEDPSLVEKKKGLGKKEKEPKFTEEHRVLWTDLGKIIGRQGMNLKIIKASIGCEIQVPRQEKDGKGKAAKDGKGKGKKGKMRDADGNKVGRGIGDGSTKLKDDQANGGKRCIEIMLGYGRNVERALADLGVEAKLPSLEEMTGGGVKAKKKDVDPMDPASYSDAPLGAWSAGLKKPGQKGQGPGGAPRDSKTANAERF
eukprot:s7461_g2.t1